MRSRKADLKRRVNGNAHYRTGPQEVTSHAGLELVREYLRRSGFTAMLRRTVGAGFPSTDFGAAPMILCLLGLILVGGRRISHLGHEHGDPVLGRFAGLARLPAPRTASAWMQRIDSEDVERLSRLNEELVGNALRDTGGRRLTLDIDGSVVSTGLKVKGACRGYNPHRRKVPSYYPVTACEAQEGQIVRLQNRPGNIHDGKAAVGFIGDLIRQVRDAVGRRRILELRMDGAFFRQDVLDVLDPAGVEYAIKVPFYPWLNLRQVAARAHWKRVDDRTWCYETRQTIWGRVRRVVLYRRHVNHKTRKNFQLDLFDPDCGHYEYSAIATNRRIQGRTLWHFYNGRGSHEKVYGELKGGFAFDCVPSLEESANAAWQMLSVLAFNLSRSFQAKTAAPRRNTNRKRRARRRFETIHTLRYKLLGRAAVVLRPRGKTTLHLGASPAVANRFLAIQNALRA